MLTYWMKQIELDEAKARGTWGTYRSHKSKQDDLRSKNNDSSA